MALGQDTGQTPDRRDQEATDILRRLLDDENCWRFSLEEVDDKTRDFLTKMRERYLRYGKLRFITAGQLYWLRDVYAKH